MKNASVLSLSITFIFMMVMPSAIGSEQAELQSIEQKTPLSRMDIARYDLIDGKIDANQAIKIIKDTIHLLIRVIHSVRKVIPSDEAQDTARLMIVFLTDERDMYTGEYMAARGSLSTVEQAQLDIRYNAFKAQIDELIHEQQIITGQAMSTLKKIVLGAAAVGVVLLLGRYMSSINQAEQTVSPIDDIAQRVPEIEQQMPIPQVDTEQIGFPTDAEIERDALMKQIAEEKAQLEAEKESNALRSAGQKMIDQKIEERSIEKSLQNTEWQYKEDIARKMQLTEQGRKQLRKQAWFDVAASYALTGISLLLAPKFPLIGGSIFVPLKYVGYTLNPAASIARTAAIVGAVGVYRFIQSMPEDRPIPKIFEHINPH